MAKFGEIFYELVIKTLERTYQFMIEFVPRLTWVLVVLLIGWVCALLIRKILSKLLKALGFDVLSGKTGLKRFLEKGGVETRPSALVGMIFYWVIIFSTLMMIFNTLEIEAASALIQGVIAALPRFTIAFILLGLGVFLGHFADRFVRISFQLARIPLSSFSGKAARYLIVGLAVALALDYLGVATAVIIEYAIIVFGIVPLIAALTFLVAGRDVLASIIAGRFIMKEYNRGDAIEFDSVSGRIESVGLLTTRIKSAAGETLIPNAILAQKIVRKSENESAHAAKDRI